MMTREGTFVFDFLSLKCLNKLFRFDALRIGREKWVLWIDFVEFLLFVMC